MLSPAIESASTGQPIAYIEEILMGQHAESRMALPLRDVALLRLKAKTDREQTRMSPATAAFSNSGPQ